MGTASVGVSRVGGNCIRCAKPAPTTHEVAVALVDESLKLSPIVGAGTIGLMVLGFYGDSFTGTCASEGSRSLMGGSTVVMCVPLG